MMDKIIQMRRTILLVGCPAMVGLVGLEPTQHNAIATYEVVALTDCATSP